MALHLHGSTLYASAPPLEAVPDDEFGAFEGSTSSLQVDGLTWGALAGAALRMYMTSASSGQPGETVAASSNGTCRSIQSSGTSSRQEGAAAAVEAGQQAVARVVDSGYQVYQTAVGEAQHIAGRIIASYQEAQAMVPVHVNTLIQGTDWSVTRSELTQLLASRTGGPDGSTRTDTIATSATIEYRRQRRPVHV